MFTILPILRIGSQEPKYPNYKLEYGKSFNRNNTIIVCIVTAVLCFSSCGDLNYPSEKNVSKKILGTWDLIAAETHPDNRTNFREYWIFTETNLMVYDYDCSNCSPDLMGPFDWEYKKPNVMLNRPKLNAYYLPPQDFVAAFEILSISDDFLVILDNGWWYSSSDNYRTKMTFMKRKGDTNNSVWIH